MTVGDRVRKRRKEKNLSQLELANLAEVRPETVNRIETGKSPASLASLYKLARALDSTIDELTKDQEVAAATKKKGKKS